MEFFAKLSETDSPPIKSEAPATKSGNISLKIDDYAMNIHILKKIPVSC